LRRYLEDHEHLSRNPTPAELETLETAAQDGGKAGDQASTPEPPGHVI